MTERKHLNLHEFFGNLWSYRPDLKEPNGPCLLEECKYVTLES